MEKRYTEYISGFCPHKCRMNTIKVEFVEFANLAGRKAMSADCEFSSQCPYSNACPILTETK